jgi:putative peptidoglycan lipid II flippase
MALVSVAVNIALCVGLFHLMGHVGIALATALAAWLHIALLGRRLIARGFLTFDQRLRRRLPRALLASLVMGLVVWGIAQGVAPWLELGLAAKAGALGLLVAGGLVSYFGLAVATRAIEREDVKLLTRRPPGPRP